MNLNYPKPTESIDVAKNDPCKLLLHHGYQRNNWSEYHNPMIPVKREALQTHWRKKKAHQGTKWKRRFDDRQDRYQEDKLLQPPKGVTIEQHNSITWLTGEKKIEVNKSGKKVTGILTVVELINLAGRNRFKFPVSSIISI